MAETNSTTMPTPPTPPTPPSLPPAAATEQAATVDKNSAAFKELLSAAVLSAIVSMPDAAIAAIKATKTPVAIHKELSDSKGHRAPIELGQIVTVRAVFGRIQNPNTQDWFDTDTPKKIEVDPWIMAQYYTDPARLAVDE